MTLLDGSTASIVSFGAKGAASRPACPLGRAGYVGPAVEDQLELACPRVHGQVVGRDDFELYVLHVLPREDLSQPRGHGGRGRVALRGVERRVEANHEAKLGVAEEVQLKARDAGHEDF